MNNSETILQNREDAGRKLAKILVRYSAENPIILGLPRGGVVVAYEVAKALQAPLDIIVARKLGAPSQPEYAIGAIAPGEVRLLNAEAISSLGISEVEIENLTSREKKEMERRIKLYRGNKSALDLKNKTAIIVDDGVATGLTALAAIRSVRKSQPQKVIFACGVCAPEALVLIQPEVTEVISLILPASLAAVGEWYQDFSQTTDAEILRLLK